MRAIEFGRYWKETNLENLPIEWAVLDETDEYLFVISKQSIVSKMFDTTTASWKDSSIRKWLNDEFLWMAFNEYERPSILEKKITTSNDFESIWGGFSQVRSCVKTVDKIFLLSVEEVEKLFKTQKDRIAERSQYAIDTLEDDRKFVNAWWLRNETDFAQAALLVVEDGSYYAWANVQNLEGIRPAMYIKRNYNEFIPNENQLQFNLE